MLSSLLFIFQDSFLFFGHISWNEDSLQRVMVQGKTDGKRPREAYPDDEWALPNIFSAIAIYDIETTKRMTRTGVHTGKFREEQ